MPYRTIVVGTDGSPRAHGAVREAAELAATSGAQLVLVIAHASGDTTDDDEDGRAIAKEAGAADVELVAAEGAPTDVLLHVVAVRGADLLVVGSKGMTDASRFVIGSVANTLSHHATCDLLIVQTREGD